ncbi:N-acetylglucosaminyldiphosphoundecaprenol N-acetyl-beta-D-mannosaminyltransferase [Branchiibius hedensis]|uniref:N-acetylglucosaminyldiphosphoundecaprenol N-acetyl-beta-D-mannosaminyltransferase n=1 Tax=Branchiibius hedensis TaxID=672460 RepID=A0A2Y8ZNN2_9MICO|nr:WecB/TagA/CpsF family glycosyltransferase [Branchiibius hedensis]PWJ25115.1 N-acetylglucosaminyldiphosphoundecaprenol N-acetyl-beta-D-mannosaminyltransferase [Branchiibius hedensis]SSA33930.1 N-acetylglucosaminyldiphosphoundecaprenol N-acetyl-beta-D-mannosaminyltransferase [Branchiibius hedensis]
MSLPSPPTERVFARGYAPREDQHRVGGVDFTVATLDTAVDQLLRDAVDEHRTRGWSVRLANAYSVVVADEDSSYAQVLNGVGSTYADGAPIEWIMKRRNVTGAGRVRGPSLFKECLRRGQTQGVRHFFLGTTEETLAALVAQVSHEFPAAKIAGQWAPPFGPVDAAFVSAAQERIGDTDPHIIWVALGTPKQDFAAAQLAAATGALCVGVGAAFDFVAQTKAEAPEWMQRAGVEWLFRLASEPRRLAHRYLVGNAQFVRIVARS